MFIALSLGFLWLVGCIVALKGIQTAPIGEETPTGFEMAWRNDQPAAQDISCVWLPGEAEVAFARSR